MESSTDVCLNFSGHVNILANNIQHVSPTKISNDLAENSSDDDGAPIQRIKKRLQQFSDSEEEKENLSSHSNGKSSSENNGLVKSRTQLDRISSDSDSLEESQSINEQKIRQNNKRLKMKQKFHGLLSSRTKSTHMQNNGDVESNDTSENSCSEISDNEMSSIAKIKQKIKKSIAALPSICDPDTSDEENKTSAKVIPKERQKKAQKATKVTEAQPMRISAKQAMENMHLIKSESNRMLREKAVSLPYHKPKALTLKDIMSRRKPAVSSDGKVLPIKMNEEQLKQYALQLEQRQKEMIELCKSESDEETVEKCEVADPNLAQSENLDKCKESDPSITESEKFVYDQKTELNNTEGMVETVVYSSNFENDNNQEITVESIDQNESFNITAVDGPEIKSVVNEVHNGNESLNSVYNQNDSNTDMRLVYNDDSIEEENALNNVEDTINAKKIDHLDTENNCTDNVSEEINKEYSENASQSIHLHYTEIDSEGLPKETNDLESEQLCKPKIDINKLDNVETDKHDFLFDDDLDMAEIDFMIENAEVTKDDEDDINNSKPVNDTLQIKPKLMGAPGMVIDLDTGPIMQKRSGVELLKEKFIYFSKLKTPEELEREKEKRLKPGAQHLKLKQELEEKIAEQRSLEWAKRLEEEKQQNDELDAILDDADDADDSVDKLKIKLKEDDVKDSDSESEEELVEDDIEIKDKPIKHNPMVDDEAEESDIEEDEEETKEVKENEDDVVDDQEDVEEDHDTTSDDDDSSESEEDTAPRIIKKGRILKAFEDSDDEDAPKEKVDAEKDQSIENNNKEEEERESKETIVRQPNCELPGSSEDDVIQLAQRHASVSEDLFTSQEYSAPNEDISDEISAVATQSFSISSAMPDQFLCSSQPYHDPNLKDIADGFSQNLLGSQLNLESQAIGEDILELCTGKFYDNEFVSQSNDDESNEIPCQGSHKDKNIACNNKVQDVNVNYNLDNISTDNDKLDNLNVNKEKDEDVSNVNDNLENIDNNMEKEKVSNDNDGGKILKSILDELDDPEFDKPKVNKYFNGGQIKHNPVENSQKKRLIIDSDDEVDKPTVADIGKKTKLKKKKLEDRALQFSDDEEEEDVVESDFESDLEDDTGKLVEYDSEENEIIVQADERKKKRKTTDFFEQEAELTSEDEWVGSGDEDEHGLDRMEREEGDDDVFHQGQLKKELGQIHMRDVLDQDKREVRLLQELLFEDGDLGGGHRQRKFRWKNTGDEEAGTVPDEFTDTQEEEFESEEQWRKQRHEREVFLRQMQKQDDEETTLNVTVNRTTIIKANLSSKSMSMLLMEANQSKIENTETVPVAEKKPVKDVPSPKKTFSILKQNYHGSLLTRGRGALARLAALATPLAVDDDAPKISSLAPHKRNFVFTSVTKDDQTPKVTIKRKADVSTPRLMKKMRTEEKQSHPKSSLLDHLNL